MKKLISIMAAYVLFIQINYATVHTVTNSPFGGAQHGSLMGAYNAASNGDTVMLEGTDVAYTTQCGVLWNKSLTVIGIGFNPQKQNPRRAKIAEIPCHGPFAILNGGSGSRFYGIEFTYHVATWQQPINDLLFENCKFNTEFNFNGQPSSNFVFRNCVFDNDNNVNLILGSGGLFEGAVINCIFDGYIEGQNGLNVNLLVDHCIFTSPGAVFNNLRTAQIQNSIFVQNFPQGTFNSEYTNNLAMVPGTFPPVPSNGNTGSGNIENTDPLFINYSPGSYYSTSWDFDVQAGSAVINAGSDGTDIGVHGGTSYFSESGEVLITPIIRAMTILNGSVASNGTLNVHIHATKPNTD